jgi:hypothetical protein
MGTVVSIDGDPGDRKIVDPLEDPQAMDLLRRFMRLGIPDPVGRVNEFRRKLSRELLEKYGVCYPVSFIRHPIDPENFDLQHTLYSLAPRFSRGIHISCGAWLHNLPLTSAVFDGLFIGNDPDLKRLMPNSGPVSTSKGVIKEMVRAQIVTLDEETGWPGSVGGVQIKGKHIRPTRRTVYKLYYGTMWLMDRMQRLTESEDGWRTQANRNLKKNTSWPVLTKPIEKTVSSMDCFKSDCSEATLFGEGSDSYSDS